MTAITHRDLMDGKIIMQGDNYIVVLKEGRKFRMEFDNHSLKEIKKQQ